MHSEPSTPQINGAPPGRWLRLILFTMGPSLALLLGLVVLVGRSIGDISPLLQWISWVPVVMLLPILLVGLMLSLFARGRCAVSLRFLGSVAFASALVWVTVVDFGFLRSGTVVEDDLVLVNWNATILPGEESFEEALLNSNQALELLSDLDADVLVIFNGGYLRLASDWKVFQDRFDHSARSATVMVLSHHEILEVRPILASGGSLILKIRIRHLGSERIIWGFDLPSSPRLSRSELFQTLRGHLDGLTQSEPEVLVGDFNVPRGSRSLKRAFPDHRSAFSEAGTGWSGTWPNAFPLWDLDQVLVGPGLTAVEYEVITPPHGMHRIQRVALRW